MIFLRSTVSLNSLKGVIPERNAYSFKGQNGKVLVIGGSSDYVGAPALAAMSAMASLRAGTDIVTVCAPEKAGYVINSFSPDLIVKKFKGEYFVPKHAKEIISIAEKFDAILIGPGMGLNKETKKFAIELVKKLMQKNKKIPLILDADALKACAKMKFNGNILITPHKKELEIFSGKKMAEKGFNLNNRIKLAEFTAKKFNCIVLLKGHIDVISDRKKTMLNKTGNPAMAAGGTGDVLAGLCAGLAALNHDLFKSACAAAYINGFAGNKLMKKKASLTASDLIEEIPFILKKILK